jgi:rod shape determining protein RodA
MKDGFKSVLIHGDHVTNFVFAALLVVGAVMVRSATFGTRFASLAPRQMMWDGIAVAVFLVAALVPYEIWIDYSYVFYGLCIVALVTVLVAGHSVAGSKSWIYLGPIGFQPSELAKVAAALAASGYIKDLSHKRIEARQMVIMGLIIGAPLVLTLMQPDFGTATTFIPLAAVVFYMSSLPLRKILKWTGIGLAGVAVAFAIGWLTFFKPYQKERVLTFLNPGSDLKGAGYQVHQARIAVGSGEIAGKGLFSGTQNRLNFLPAPHTDFIMGVVAEETGFLGSVGVLSLFLILLLRFLNTGAVARDMEGRFLVLCAFAVILYHLVINVGMVIGLVPTAGIPLPFLSYGGSSLMCMSLFAGLAANVRSRRFVQ